MGMVDCTAEPCWTSHNGLRCVSGNGDKYCMLMCLHGLIITLQTDCMASCYWKLITSQVSIQSHAGLCLKVEGRVGDGEAPPPTPPCVTHQCVLLASRGGFCFFKKVFQPPPWSEVGLEGLLLPEPPARLN